MMAMTPRRLAGLALLAAALLAPAPWGVLALAAALTVRVVVLPAPLAPTISAWASSWRSDSAT